MSKRKYEDLKEILCHELNEITRKGEMDRETLDNVYKLTSSIDVLKKLIKENKHEEDEDEEYSQDYNGASYRMNPMTWSNANRRGYSRMYSEGDMSDDYSQARGRDAQTGRYMSRDGSSYEGYDRDYSRHDAEEKVVQKLQDILAGTHDSHIRKAIMKAMDVIES